MLIIVIHSFLKWGRQGGPQQIRGKLRKIFENNSNVIIHIELNNSY